MKVLIIDKVHLYLIEELARHNYQVDYLPEISYEETLSIIEDYNGIVVRSKFQIDKYLMEKATNLKFVARAGVGLDIFDLEYTKKNNIKVLNAAGANANAVAEHALGMLLSLSSKISKANKEVKNFQWNREGNRATEIHGKIIGVIGYGNTGQAFAKKLSEFGCEILAYDKFKTNFSNKYVTESSLEILFEKADIISLHIPLTEDTNYMCNDVFFNSFKKPIVFINTARGKITNTKSLVNALRDKKVIGACLDVLENEKLTDLSSELEKTYKALFSKDNVILSPHVAGWSYQSYENISRVLSKNILELTN